MFKLQNTRTMIIEKSELIIMSKTRNFMLKQIKESVISKILSNIKLDIKIPHIKIGINRRCVTYFGFYPGFFMFNKKNIISLKIVFKKAVKILMYHQHVTFFHSIQNIFLY